jgi:2-dehydropantoate 2-reductase
MGARLVRHGRAAVTLAGTWEAALQAIASRGIVVNESGGVWTAKVRVAPLAGPFGPADIVLVAVKSHRTAAVAASAARALLPASLVVTLQNGLGNLEALQAACGAGCVVGGVASLTATLIQPGEVRVVAGRVVLSDHAPGAARFADLLTHSRLDAGTSPEIERMLWAKLAVTCAIGPLSALTGRTNGTLLETPEPCETLQKAAREAGAVALAKGIDIGGDAGHLAVAAAESTAGDRSAMCHDLERRVRTEVDAQNGAVVREGQRLGLPLPVNEYLWQRIREKEGRSAVPDGSAAND